MSTQVHIATSARFFALGMTLGLLIHVAAFGLNYFSMRMIAITDQPYIAQDAFLSSMIWSFVTSLVSMLLLALVRQTLSTGRDNCPTQHEIRSMEYAVVTGAITGICATWVLMDAALGLSKDVAYALVTLTLALGWCRVMVRCFALSAPEQTSHDDNELEIA